MAESLTKVLAVVFIHQIALTFGRRVVETPSFEPTEEPTSFPTISCPLPLVEWDFGDLLAEHDYQADPLTTAFDLELYSSDEYDQNPLDGVGPYLDGNGNLICDGGSAGSYALSYDSIPFDTTAPKTLFIIGHPNDFTTYTSLSFMSITRNFEVNPMSATSSAAGDNWIFDDSAAIYDSFEYLSTSGYEYPSASNEDGTNYFAWVQMDSIDNKYYTLVYEADGTVKFYHNCQEQATVNVPARLFPGNDGSRFMFCQHTPSWTGSGSITIDFAGYFDYALTDIEVQELCDPACLYDSD